jgi:hypothetical protein
VRCLVVVACELVELRHKGDIKLAKQLVDRYHAQGVPRGGAAARGHRWFAWVCDGYICAVAWLHDNTPFRFVAERFMIPSDNSYFIRRICRTCPGVYLVDFLNAIAERLRAEGKEVLWTLGLDDHSNALYKRAGFEELGRTPRSGHPVFAKRLR